METPNNKKELIIFADFQIGESPVELPPKIFEDINVMRSLSAGKFFISECIF
jgi:hypothetical protein